MFCQNFDIICLLEFSLQHNFDIICLPETFLDSSVDISDTRVNINGYSLLRVDHPSDTKRSGVCVYYKDYLPLQIVFYNFQVFLVTKITIGKEKRFLPRLYRLPSQKLMS